MSDLTSFGKARLEMQKGKSWFNGYINEAQAKADIRLDPSMIDYWYGREYHRIEVAGNEFK